MSIIEQTLNRLDADKPGDDTDDGYFHPGFALKRRSRNAPRWALLTLVVALGGGAAWWYANDLTAESAVVDVMAPAVVQSAGVDAPVVAPVPAAVVVPSAASGALPVVRPTVSQAPLEAASAPSAPAAAYLDMAPRWLLEGIKLHASGSKEDAQAVWSEGVMALPGYHRVWLPDSYPSEAAASAAFAEAARQYPVLLLTSKKSGRTQSHVFAYADGEENQALADGLAQKMGVSSGRWVTAASLRLQLKGMTLDKAAPADTGAVAVRKTTPKPAPKPVAARRPLAQAKMAAPVAEPAPAISLPVPSAAPSVLARAEKLINANQAVEALFELRSAIGPELEDWRYHYLVGAAEMKLGRQVKAQEALSTAIKLNPRQPEARLKRAVLNQEQGLHNDAMADLREAEKIAPQLPEVYLNQGYSADALNRLGEARTAYLQFLNLSKSKANYGATRAWVTKRLGDLNTETR